MSQVLKGGAYALKGRKYRFKITFLVPPKLAGKRGQGRSGIASAQVTQLVDDAQIRALALAGGLAAAVTVWVGHVAPSQEIVSTPWEPMLVVAVATLSAATLVLLATIHRVAAVVAAPIAAFSVWAIATSAAGKIGIRVGNLNYVWALLGAAVVVSAVCILLRVRAAVGIGLLLSGVLGMVLNGAWEPTGALGDGQGNIPVLLVTIGWGWTAISVSVGWWAQPPAARLRARVASWLTSVARRVAPDIGS